MLRTFFFGKVSRRYEDGGAGWAWGHTYVGTPAAAVWAGEAAAAVLDLPAFGESVIVADPGGGLADDWGLGL
jgi:hypothetical protein